MTTILNGRYYDGATAQDLAMRLSVDVSGRITADPPLLHPDATISEVTVDPRIAGLPAVMRFTSGAIFETPQHDTVDRLLRAHGRPISLAHRLERRNRNALLSIVVAAAMLILVIGWGIPAFSSVLAPLVPMSVESRLGKQTLEQLDRFILKPSTLPPERRARLQALFQDLARQRGGDLPLALELRHGGRIVNANAFTLPGGTIVLTDEIVALANSDDQIAAVMLHEFGHVRHRHLMQRLLGDSAVTVLSFIIFGDASAGASVLLALPTLLLELRYSRAMETEADDFSLDGMRAVGLDPHEVAGMLGRLGAYVGWCTDLMKHRPEDAKQPCEVSAYLADVARGTVPTRSEAEADGDNNDKDAKKGSGWTNYTQTHPDIRIRIQHLDSRLP